MDVALLDASLLKVVGELRKQKDRAASIGENSSSVLGKNSGVPK